MENPNQPTESNAESQVNGPILKEPPGLMKQFYRDFISVLTEPRAFFSGRFNEIGHNQAIALGLLVSWIGAFAEWIIRSLKSESLLDGLSRIKKQLQTLPIWKDLPEDIWSQGESIQSTVPEWAVEGLRMLLTPFHHFFMFYTYGFIFWIGALMLVPSDNPNKVNVHYKNLVKIAAICAVGTFIGSILNFLPVGIGGFIGWIYQTVLLMIAFSTQFNISRLRSLIVIFLPTILSFLIMVVLIGMLVGLLLVIVSSLFH